MRFLSPSLAIGLLLCCLNLTTTVHGYYFSELKDDLATLESTPGVSIVYPRAVGPSATEVEGNEVPTTDVKGSEEAAATTTTTAPPTTTDAAVVLNGEAVTTTAAPTTTTEASSSSESTPGMAWHGTI